MHKFSKLLFLISLIKTSIAVDCPAWIKYGKGPPSSCPTPSDPLSKPASPIESWLTEEVFNDLFIKANLGFGPNKCSPYSYQSFIIAARYFPKFGNDYVTKDPSGHSFKTKYTKEETYRRDISAFFAHSIQETGENDVGLYNKLSVDQADACFYRGGLFNWFEGGPETSFVPNQGLDPKDGSQCVKAARYCAESSAAFWPCNEKNTNNSSTDYYRGCYFGRGSIQISYNFNYGPFSRWLNIQGVVDNGKPIDLLQNPNLVMTKTDPPLTVMASLWFFMTAQPPKPAMHDIIIGNWVPNDEDRASGFQGPILGPTSLIINNECNGMDPKPPGGGGENRRIRAFMWFTSYFKVPTGDKLSCKGMKGFTVKGEGQSWDCDWHTSWKPGPCNCSLATYPGPISGFDPKYFPQFTDKNAQNKKWCENALNGGWQADTAKCAGRKKNICIAKTGIVTDDYCEKTGCKDTTYCKKV